MRLFIGLSVACLLSLSFVAAVHAATNENTNISSSESLNAVGIGNSNVASQTQIGSISDSFKAYDIDISESFRTEGNDTDIASGNTVDSFVDNNHNFKGNVVDNDGNAIGNDDNFSDNAVDNDFNAIDNDGNLNANVVDNDNNAAFNDDNFSDNVVNNDNNVVDNDGNVINP